MTILENFVWRGDNDMKKTVLLLVPLLFIGLVWGQVKTPEELDSSFSKGWDGSASYGLLSEKIPFTFIEFSGLLNIDKHSEF